MKCFWEELTEKRKNYTFLFNTQLSPVLGLCGSLFHSCLFCQSAAALGLPWKRWTLNSIVHTPASWVQLFTPLLQRLAQRLLFVVLSPFSFVDQHWIYIICTCLICPYWRWWVLSLCLPMHVPLRTLTREKLVDANHRLSAFNKLWNWIQFHFSVMTPMGVQLSSAHTRYSLAGSYEEDLIFGVCCGPCVNCQVWSSIHQVLT